MSPAPRRPHLGFRARNSHSAPSPTATLFQFNPRVNLFTAMGTFYTPCVVQNHLDRKKQYRLPKVLVDTGSEYTWIPAATLEGIGIAREKKDLAFLMANGQQITRSVGFAIVRIGECFTADEVVFAEKGDLLLLGARTLEGLNLLVSPRDKKLVAAGLIPAAIARLRPSRGA